jgi:hypothetical protein
MKIACDNGIAFSAIAEIERHGHEVVFRALDDPDEWWFAEALKYGAECFVSHDWDIILMADAGGLKSIQMPNGIKGKAQADFVVRRLR